MAITYGFFNSVNGDRKYNAKNIGRYLHGIVSSGVYADTSSSLQVLAGDGLRVQVQPGRAMLDYHYMENDAPLTLTLSTGGTQDRYDAIVAVLDVTNRLCKIEVKQGTPAASPTVPTVQRSDTTKEYMLAYVRVAKYAAAITQENITDTRPDNSVCGWVHGLIEQVDTSTLHKQYEDAYSRKMKDLDDYVTEKKEDIDARLEALDKSINNAGSVGVPVPSISNKGQVPTVNSYGTGYELKDHPIKVVSVSFESSEYAVKFDQYDKGLYLFLPAAMTAYGSGVMAMVRTAADTYEAVGERVPAMLCYIWHEAMYINSEKTTDVYFLHDISSGRLIRSLVGVSGTSYTHSVTHYTAKTINSTKPDATGNVDT